MIFRKILFSVAAKHAGLGENDFKTNAPLVRILFMLLKKAEDSLENYQVCVFNFGNCIFILGRPKKKNERFKLGQRE